MLSYLFWDWIKLNGTRISIRKSILDSLFYYVNELDNGPFSIWFQLFLIYKTTECNQNNWVSFICNLKMEYHNYIIWGRQLRSSGLKDVIIKCTFNHCCLSVAWMALIFLEFRFIDTFNLFAYGPMQLVAV